MNAAGQAVAGGVERLDQRRQRLALEPQHMQHRAEHLAAEVGDKIDLDDRRRDESPAVAGRAERRAGHREAASAHRFDIGVEIGLRCGADHRSDVGGKSVGRADVEFGDRRLDHRQHAIGDIVLQAEDAQGRATLSGRVEGRGQRIANHLLGQGRRIDDQGVLAAGLGDQRDRLAVRPQAAGQSGGDQLGDFGRAGEHHPADLIVPRQHCANRAVARREDQGVLGDAGFMHQLDGRRGDQRRLFGRLGDHRVAGGQRRGDLAGEDGDGEVPRADADDRSERAMGLVGEAASSDGSAVVAQEVDRLADVAERVGQRLARLAANQAGELARLVLQSRRRAGENRGSVLRGSRRPGRAAAACRSEGALDVRFRRVDDGTDHVSAVGGIDDRPRLARAAGAPGVAALRPAIRRARRAAPRC